MGMGIEQWEWEGMGIPIVFPHTSNGNGQQGRIGTRKRPATLLICKYIVIFLVN